MTGILVDTDAIAACLHRYNALAIFDYAGAGPYVQIDMNPGPNSKYGESSYKDAIVCSPHKFVGGPGTVGVLVCKNRLFINDIPSSPGGGTVIYVTQTSHKYTNDLTEREEGGTPAIVESIRTGLVFGLKDALTVEKIMARDDDLVSRAVEKWRECPNLMVLGGFDAHRLPIFSFCIFHPESQRLLHHNFVSKILSDLFGIQSRGGCMCAGPYAEQLLGISEDLALRIGEVLSTDQNKNLPENRTAEILKPGFCRLNLPYYADDSEIDFIIDAVVLISEHGWKLLPQYTFEAGTGEWRHREDTHIIDGTVSLKEISYQTGSFHFQRPTASKDPAPTLEEVLSAAQYLLRGKIKQETIMCSPCSSPFLRREKPKKEITRSYGEEWECLRWFLLPSEAQQFIEGTVPDTCKDYKILFCPGCPSVGDKQKTMKRQDSTTFHCSLFTM